MANSITSCPCGRTRVTTGLLIEHEGKNDEPLKSPWDEYANVAGAHNRLQHYRADIPCPFEFNALCVLSDGHDALQE